METKTKQQTLREKNDAVPCEEVADGTTYGEMTIGQFNTIIELRERIAKSCKPREYELKEIAEDEKTIERQEEKIAEKKAEYEEAIKWEKDHIKATKKKMKERAKRMAETEKYRKRFENEAKMFRDMRDRKNEEAQK